MTILLAAAAPGVVPRVKGSGVDCRMIPYSGFGHGVNEPNAMRAVMTSNLNWFSHYIWENHSEGFARSRFK